MTRRFRVTLKRPWGFDHISDRVDEPVTVEPGTYDVEETVSSAVGEPWLVFSGTGIGWERTRWQSWQSPNYGDFQIQLQPVDDEPPHRKANDIAADQAMAFLRRQHPEQFEKPEPRLDPTLITRLTPPPSSRRPS